MTATSKRLLPSLKFSQTKWLKSKTVDKHGYEALKVACGQSKKKVSKAVSGEYKKADVAGRRFLREIPVVDGAEQGSKITAEVLNAEVDCDISGTQQGSWLCRYHEASQLLWSSSNAWS